MYRSIAASIEMRQERAALALHPSALLFYTNPERGNDQHGAIFLWTSEGRPVVLGSIWSAIDRQDPTQRSVTHEWHSLVENPDVTATRGGELLWTANEPAIKWETPQDSAAPGPTRSLRLVQLRNLARGISAHITEAGKTELRLMPQPLYRYPEISADKNSPDKRDGAIFGYSLGTDPELLLMIESDGEQQWRMAFARLGGKPMTARDATRELWSCEKAVARVRQGKYFLYWRAEFLPANLEENKK
jgi:hypothetical protein